ncbi:hypothetical protein INT43_005722 [Umbelopsis isabellina]|uniref:WW domain-containing protein n=1 Tax=Mortierella isabellina TaxID=91625 RepID=A0A8H7UCH5_MORIS|nr:hypothetical protein INT43_005722 [Umbelopsis isabellina]
MAKSTVKADLNQEAPEIPQRTNQEETDIESTENPVDLDSDKVASSSHASPTSASENPEERNDDGGENGEESYEVEGPHPPLEGENVTEETAWVPTWDEASQAYYWWNTMTNETTWDNPYPEGEGNPENAEDAQAYSEDPQYYANQGYYDPGYADNQYETGPAGSNPLDAVLSKIDTEVRGQLDKTTETERPFQSYNELFGPSETIQQQPTSAYESVAHFNSRTGKFTSSLEADRLNPEYMSLESRAKRQMQYYFDVDAYQEQRNRERQSNVAGQKRPLTKKEIEKFKRQKQEKKEKRKREWLSKDYD